MTDSGSAKEDEPSPGDAAADRATNGLREHSDATLVGAARAGDADAFGELYRRHVPMVNAIVMVRVPATEARDLVQEVFAQALRKLGTLRQPASLGPWLASISRTLAAVHHRRARPTASVAEASLRSSDPSPEARAALEALRTLPDAYRETLALRLVAGMTGPEIAERTGLTPGSVRVNLCRGLKLLRARLEDDSRA